MSEQAMAVPVAVEGVEPRVATTGPVVVPVVDRGLVAQLVGEAQRQGLPVDGEGGLLAELTRLVLEAPRTRSSRSTPASARPSGPGATSPTSRPR